MFCPIQGEAGAGISRDDYIDKVASDVLAKLPKEFDMDQVRKKFGIEITPTTVVLLQELERFNKLVSRMEKSLSTLKKVCSAVVRKNVCEMLKLVFVCVCVFPNYNKVL